MGKIQIQWDGETIKLLLIIDENCVNFEHINGNWITESPLPGEMNWQQLFGIMNSELDQFEKKRLAAPHPMAGNSPPHIPFDVLLNRMSHISLGLD